MKGGGGVGGDEAQSPARVTLQPGGKHTFTFTHSQRRSLKKAGISLLVYAGFGAGLPEKRI